MPRSLDAQKTMQDLLAGLNAKPEFLAGFNTDYLNNANQLFQNLTGQLGGIDTEEAQTRADAERGLGDLAGRQSQAIQALKDRMANRGTLHSTAFDESQQNLVKDFESQRADIGSARDRMLQSLIGRRGAAEGGYDQALMGLNDSLTRQAGDYINVKSGEERDRRLAEQAATGQGQLTDQSVGQTNNMIPQLAPPAIDMSAIVRALQPAPPPVLPARFTQPPPVAPPKPVAPVAPKPSVFDPGRVAMTSSVNNSQLAKLSKVKNPWFGASKRS